MEKSLKKTAGNKSEVS
ncbi:hypothetical protein [Aeribacillus composti]